jgi:hypothetical protein
MRRREEVWSERRKVGKYKVEATEGEEREIGGEERAGGRDEVRKGTTERRERGKNGEIEEKEGIEKECGRDIDKRG